MLKPKTIQKMNLHYIILSSSWEPQNFSFTFFKYNNFLSYVIFHIWIESVEPLQCFKKWSLCERGFLTRITKRFTESFRSFVPNTHELYIMLSHCNNIVVILQKHLFNPVTFIFWIKYWKYIAIHWLPLLTLVGTWQHIANHFPINAMRMFK